MPSPAVSTTWPRCSVISVRRTRGAEFSGVREYLLRRPHQARVPRHVGSEDRGEAADRGHGVSGRKVPLPEFTLKSAAALVSRLLASLDDPLESLARAIILTV
jgi:hypothetical protein